MFKISHASELFHSLTGEKMSKPYNRPLKNGVLKNPNVELNV